MIAGVIVQINSIICPSNIFLSIILFIIIDKIIYITVAVIIKIIIIAWSLNRINCSIIGVKGSWNEIKLHDGISKKTY